MTTDLLWNCNWFTKNKTLLDCRQLFLAYSTQTGIKTLVLFLSLFFVPLLLKGRGKNEQWITQNKGFLPSSIIHMNTRDCLTFPVYKDSETRQANKSTQWLNGNCTCILGKKLLHFWHFGEEIAPLLVEPVPSGCDCGIILPLKGQRAPVPRIVSAIVDKCIKLPALLNGARFNPRTFNSFAGAEHLPILGWSLPDLNGMDDSITKYLRRTLWWCGHLMPKAHPNTLHSLPMGLDSRGLWEKSGVGNVDPDFCDTEPKDKIPKNGIKLITNLPINRTDVLRC